MNVLIAGGTGLIGRHLTRVLRDNGHQVQVLSRTKSNPDTVYWDPSTGAFDALKVSNTEILVNLCGAGIAEKRWTASRKRELIHSRIEPTLFLHEHSSCMPKLSHYISASGINAYGFESITRPYVENDEYGNDFTSQLVKQWEASADIFADSCKVTKLRLGLVLSKKGGVIERMSDPIKKGVGAAIASGTQNMQWIHIDDLSRLVQFIIQNGVEGTLNVMTGQSSNKEFTQALASLLEKKLLLPNVPAFTMRILFGEMADLLINGPDISNENLLKTGFDPEYVVLDEALASLK